MSTVSQAKNVMKRAVAEIVDRPLTRHERDMIWEYFESRCAYCGKKLSRTAGVGQLEHLDPKGGNHVGSRVLACGICNGDHKRDGVWLTFLRQVSPPADYAARVSHMEDCRNAIPGRNRSACLPLPARSFTSSKCSGTTSARSAMSSGGSFAMRSQPFSQPCVSLGGVSCPPRPLRLRINVAVWRQVAPAVASRIGLAMQKVEGSSPFIRSSWKPCKRGTSVV